MLGQANGDCEGLGFLLTQYALGLIGSGSQWFDIYTKESSRGIVLRQANRDLDSYLRRMPWDSLGQVPNGSIYTPRKALGGSC